MRNRWGLLMVIAAMAGALLFAACDDDPEATPTAEATTAATAEATAVPNEEATGTATAEPTAEASAFPLTVRDLLGREVTIEAPPQNIVATSPSAIEMLYAAGGTAIARSETSSHPEGIGTLPSVGPSYAPAFEAMIALGPDLILADASAQGHLADAFEGALRGVPIVFVGAVGYADVATSIR